MSPIPPLNILSSRPAAWLAGLDPRERAAFLLARANASRGAPGAQAQGLKDMRPICRLVGDTGLSFFIQLARCGTVVAAPLVAYPWEDFYLIGIHQSGKAIRL